MTWLLIIQFPLALVNLWMANWHAILWRAKRPIKHGWWGLSYVAILFILSFLLSDCTLFISGLFNRQLVFDNMFDKLRGYSVTYHSVTTTSIIDRIENLFFRGNWYIETAVYLSLFISTLVMHKQLISWQDQLVLFMKTW